MKERDKRNSHINSELHMIYISSNNIRHPVTKTFMCSGIAFLSLWEFYAKTKTFWSNFVLLWGSSRRSSGNWASYFYGAAFVMLCSSQRNCSQYSRCIITIIHSFSIPGNGLTTMKSYLVHGWHVDVSVSL
jgi:hypothetical protein